MKYSRKDLQLVKAGLRRAFSRSEFRNKLLDDCMIQGHSDPIRTRVKKWYKCDSCLKPHARYEMQADHIDPVIDVFEDIEELTPSQLAGRVWCDRSNLQRLCRACHYAKSGFERKERAAFRKARKTLKAEDYEDLKDARLSEIETKIQGKTTKWAALKSTMKKVKAKRCQ